MAKQKGIGRDEEIESIEQLETALKQMKELDAAIAIANADCETEIADVRAKYADRLILKKGKEPLTVPQLREELARKVASYAWANKDKLLLNAGGKYVQLTHGRIKWAKTPDSLDTEAADAETSPAAGTLKHLLSQVNNFVAKSMVSFIGAKIAAYVSVSIKWNNKAIKADLKRGKLDAAAAKAAGFEIKKGKEQLYIELAK